MCKILVMKISFLIIWLFSFWYALTYAISLKKPKHFFKCTLVTKELLTPSKGETSLLLPRAWPYSFPATFQWKQILQNALSPNFIANFLKCLKNICMPCLEIKEQKKSLSVDTWNIKSPSLSYKFDIFRVIKTEFVSYIYIKCFLFEQKPNSFHKESS